MRLAVALGVLAAGCASVPPPVPEGCPAPAAPALPKLRSPSGVDVAQILEQSGLAFVTMEPGRRWMVAFAGKQLPKVVLYIVHGDEFTVVLGKLFTVGKAATVEFYRELARKNYDFDQLKLSIDAAGGVFASFEVPTRILDRQELLENIFGLAGAIDAVLPDLVEHADPQLAPGGDDEEPGEDDAPENAPPPVRPGDVIEALRRALAPVMAAR